jgi:hypothetical protein
MMITITDPRIKDEIYDFLSPAKLQLRQRKVGGNQRAFYLSKAAEYYLSNKINMMDSVIQGNDEDPDNAPSGLRANLQDHYFLR